MMPRQFTAPLGVEKVRLIVAGTRDFDDYSLLCRKLDFYTFWFDDVELVSGGQRKKIGYQMFVGADYFAEKWAEENWYDRKIFHPNWDLGKKAGPLRNREMAEYGHLLVAFWDGSSPGTKSMIEEARRVKIPIRIVKYRP